MVIISRIPVVKLSLLTVLMTLAAPSESATLSVKLPGLAGDYPYTPVVIGTAPFQLGARFSRIDSVALSFTASGSPGSYELCSLLGACTVADWVPSALFYFTTEAGFDPPPFASVELLSTAPAFVEVSIESPFSLYTFDLLLDGAGTLNVSHDALTCIGCTIEVLQFPAFTIAAASLTVEGTIVPLPAAFLLLLSAISCTALPRAAYSKLRRLSTPGVSKPLSSC